jgi:RNA-directed DNA polymerase
LEEEIQPSIEAFLIERGLKLSKEKTRVTHIEEGFDFLGQTVRKYPDHGKLKLLIKPSRKNTHSFMEDIKTVFRKARSLTQAQLIKILNPKIRGWANYHRHVVSKAVFNKLDYLIWHQTLRWAKRRHPDKGVSWVIGKYFRKINGVNHRFYGVETQNDGSAVEVILLKMAYVPIRRHVRIQSSAQPFDRKYDEYFEKRTSEKWRNNSKRNNVTSHISILQKDKCPCCKEKLTINQRWCISLKCKVSLGGEYKSSNMDVIHLGCYKNWQVSSA